MNATAIYFEIDCVNESSGKRGELTDVNASTKEFSVTGSRVQMSVEETRAMSRTSTFGTVLIMPCRM